MYRTSRNNAVCFESLEKALAESSEAYGHIDLIAFGFPCQDISNANPKGKGLKGERSSIFFECMRIVDILNPTWLLIENVPRLLSINEGRDFALVLHTLSESGYGYSWRVLDSQYFGVAQRRKRVFIVGHFGGACPPEILFEQKSGSGNDTPKRKIRQRGLCISTRDGERQDPTTETIIASTIQATDYQKTPHGQFGNEGNLIANTICNYPEEKLPPSEKRRNNLIAQTIGSTPRGDSSFVWQNTHIAEVNPNGKREITRFPAELYIIGGIENGELENIKTKSEISNRGIVIGNAVTVNVAEWIGKRIVKYERQNLTLFHKGKEVT